MLNSESAVHFMITANGRRERNEDVNALQTFSFHLKNIYYVPHGPLDQG